MDKLDELNKEWEDLVVGLPLTIAERRKIANLHAAIVQEILASINSRLMALHGEMLKQVKEV